MKKPLKMILLILFIVVVVVIVCWECDSEPLMGKDTIVTFADGTFCIAGRGDPALFFTAGGSSIIGDVHAVYSTFDKVYLVGEDSTRISQKTETGAIEYKDIPYAAYAVIDLNSNTMQLYHDTPEGVSVGSFFPYRESDTKKLFVLQSFSEFSEGDQEILKNWNQNDNFRPID